MRRTLILPSRSITLPVILTSALAAATVGSVYNFTLTGGSGTPFYTWSLVSASPDTGSWLSCSSAGVLSGTPTTAETETVTVRLTDALGYSVTATLPLQVLSSTPTITTTSPLPSATVGSAYFTTITAIGGTPPYLWTIPNANPDTGAWIAINTSTGVISGTPGTAEVETISVKCRDSLSQIANATFTLTVQAVSAGATYAFVAAPGVTVPTTIFTVGLPFTINYLAGGLGARANPLPVALLRNGEDGSNRFSTDPTYSRTSITLTPSSGALVNFQTGLVPLNAQAALLWTPFASGQNQQNSATCFGGDTSTPTINITGGYGSQFYVWEKYYYNFSAMPDNIKTLRGWPPAGVGNHPDAYLSYNSTGNVWEVQIEPISGTPVVSGLNQFGGQYDVSFAHTVGAWTIDETFWQENSASGTVDGIYNVTRNAQPGFAIAGRWCQRSSTTGDVPYQHWYLDEFTAPSTPITGVPNGTTDKMVYGLMLFDDSFLQTYLTNEGTSYYTTQATHPINSALDKQREIQIQTARSDTSITLAPIRQGAFSTLAGIDVIATTDYGTGIYLGQLAAPTFDFYISTTGNDSNAGTLAAPWAITSLISSSSNQSKMPGKRIGLIAGTYNVAGTAGVTGATKIGHGAHPTDNSYCALTIPTGPNASTPTYIASSDTTGRYCARKATIAVISGQVSSSTNVWYNGLIGSGEDYASHVYVTIDGITFNGAGGTVGGMDSIAAGNEGAHIVFFQTALGSFTSSAGAAPAAILVQNCHIFGIQATDNGGNDGGVFLQNVNGVIVTNNKLHDISKQASDASHCHASESYGCQNIQWTYNTIYNCTGGALEPKVGNTNCTAAYNYIYNSGNSGVGNSAVFQAWDGAEGNPNTPNVGFSIHHNIVDSCGRVTFGESNNANHSMQVQWYNNTIYNSGEVVLNSIDSAVMMHYNNLYVLKSGTNANQVSLTSSFVSPLAYDSFYNVAGGSYSGEITGATETTGLQTGQDPVFAAGTASITAGAGSAQFALQGTSPAVGSGFTGGTSAGTAVNRGAWDGTASQIGCSFTTKQVAAGHYASFTRLSGGASNYSSIRLPQYNSDASFGTSGLTGYIVTSVWADWEPGTAGTLGGDYTLSAYLNDIQTCANNGKVIGFKILTYGSGSSPNGVIPNYMWNSSNALYPSSQLPCYYGQSPTIATSLWRCLYNNPFVQARTAALYNWLLNVAPFSLTVGGVTTNYVGFNSCPWVVILGVDEETQPSSISLCISDNGYGTRSTDGPYYYQASTWAAGYEATLALVGAYATTVQIKAPFNQLPQFTVPEAVQMANTIVNAQCTFGAPDLQPSNPGGTLAPGAVTYHNEVGVAAFLGTLSNLSALNNVPYIAEMEGDDMPGGSLYNGPTPTGSPAIQGCQWLFNFATNAAAPGGSPAYTAANLRATQIWWQILPSGNVSDPGPPIGSVWHTDVLPFINSHPFPNNYLPQGY